MYQTSTSLTNAMQCNAVYQAYTPRVRKRLQHIAFWQCELIQCNKTLRYRCLLEIAIQESSLTLKSYVALLYFSHLYNYIMYNVLLPYLIYMCILVFSLVFEGYVFQVIQVCICIRAAASVEARWCPPSWETALSSPTAPGLFEL